MSNKEAKKYRPKNSWFTSHARGHRFDSDILHSIKQQT